MVGSICQFIRESRLSSLLRDLCFDSGPCLCISVVNKSTIHIFELPDNRGVRGHILFERLTVIREVVGMDIRQFPIPFWPRERVDLGMALEPLRGKEVLIVRGLLLGRQVLEEGVFLERSIVKGYLSQLLQMMLEDRDVLAAELGSR